MHMHTVYVRHILVHFELQDWIFAIIDFPISFIIFSFGLELATQSGKLQRAFHLKN